MLTRSKHITCVNYLSFIEYEAFLEQAVNEILKQSLSMTFLFQPLDYIRINAQYIKE